MTAMEDSYLALEDGSVLAGRAVGAPGTATGEICFTTSMVGYQEAVTDPSYHAQVLVFSYPLIGNYGVADSRLESDRVWTRGVIMRRSRPAWSRWLAGQGVVALEEVDTRALVRHVRSVGAMRCGLGQASPADLIAAAKAEPHLDFERGQAEDLMAPPLAVEAGTPVARVFGEGPRVAVMDFGCKRSIVANLVKRGLEVHLVPPTWGAAQVLDLDPRVVLIGNGPGDPAQLGEPVEAIQGLLGRTEVFGICLGHQLLGLALGLKTFKLPFGHRGANHPVRVRETKRVLITVQNHGFAVEADEAAAVSHISLNDGTVEGLEGDGFFSLQFHPEAAPGPHDALPFFDRVATACRSAPTSARS